MKKVNLASKNDVADYVKRTCFDEKLKYYNKRFTSIKTKQIEVNNKLDDIEKRVN